MSIILPNPPDLPGDGLPPETPELQAQRSLTSYFIGTQSVTVQLVPRRKVKRPSGGFVWEAQIPRDVQTMRLIEPSGPALPYMGSDGVVRNMEFMLLGEWDAYLGQFDIFTLHSREWEVAELFHFNGYERRAAVIKYG